ncbi:Bifunctional riboflavin kinase/FMN adenylyltransferase [Alphaproteobacteria bacterium SO-S41]|nr:Bifunctional riboflavin kinase/FMN adenylyltransferase [Alphaproteobacteria bacterium SO-S41]
MIIARHFEAIAPAARGAVVAIGNFDGVHLGHQALIAEGQRIAKDLRAPFGILAFEPHPQEFFRRTPEKFRLTPFRTKAEMLKATGVEVLYALPFNAKMAAMTADQFIAEVLVAGLGVRHVLIGGDFQFGKNRSGGVAELQAAGAAQGFGVTIFSAVMGAGDHKISSTDIRTALKEGRPRDAARLLGHPWTVSGHVLHGDKRGRTIGFPTANVSLKGYLEPALGVYAVRVSSGGATYGGVANFGRRPTFDKQDTLLEVHLFDFAGDLYGKQIDVAFVDFIRAERKFAGLDALKAQITADGEEARRLLAGV